jgi:hypothetical protein
MQPDRLSTKLDNSAGTIINPATEERVSEVAMITDALYELIARLDWLPAARDVTGALRIMPIGVAAGPQPVNGTVTATVSGATINTIASLDGIGNLKTHGLVQAQTNLTAHLANIQNIAVS